MYGCWQQSSWNGWRFLRQTGSPTPNESQAISNQALRRDSHSARSAPGKRHRVFNLGLLPSVSTQRFPFLLPKELTDSQPHLHRVQPRVRRRQAGVGDVHVAQFRAPVPPIPQEMRTHGRAEEVKFTVLVPVGNIVIGKQRPAAEFDIRSNRAPEWQNSISDSAD